MKLPISNPWFFITLCLVLPVTAYTTLKWVSRSFESLPIYGKAQNIEISTLKNQYGRVATKPQGKITVVNFFFTHCPVVCVRMNRNMKVVHDFYVNDPDVVFMSITVDPERDSVERLKQYLRKNTINDHNWKFLTGDKKVIYNLARNQFRLVASNGMGNTADFIHSEQLVLLDDQNRIRGYYTGTNESHIKQLIIDIKKLKNESSDFITP